MFQRFVITFKDEASLSLTKSARRFIESLGSLYIGRLTWRDTWALVLQRDGQRYSVLAEGYQTSEGHDYWARPVTIHTSVVLQEGTEFKCPHLPSNDANRRRMKFCDRYEGYTAVCNCKSHYSRFTSLAYVSHV